MEKRAQIDEPYTKNVKKLSQQGNGFIVNVSKEVSSLGWGQSDMLVVMTIKGKTKKEDKIVIKKLEV